MSDHDRHFFDTFLIVLGVLVAFTVVIYAIANSIHSRTQALWIAEVEAAQGMVDERIAPVGRVALDGETAPAPQTPPPQQMAAADDPVSGEAAYASACAACHAMGVAGAPKFADAAAWSDRIAKGLETLTANAINGFQGEAGVMPAKGGRADLSDEQVAAAVEHMVNAAQ